MTLTLFEAPHSHENWAHICSIWRISFKKKLVQHFTSWGFFCIELLQVDLSELYAKIFTFLWVKKMSHFYIFFSVERSKAWTVSCSKIQSSKSQFLNVSKKQNFNIDFHSFHRDYPRFFCLKIQGVWILLRTRGTLFLNYYEVEWRELVII